MMRLTESDSSSKKRSSSNVCHKSIHEDMSRKDADVQNRLTSHLQQVIRLQRIVMREVRGHVGTALERRWVAISVQTVPFEQVNQLLLLHAKRISVDKRGRNR